jgi:hypothetical protein
MFGVKNHTGYPMKNPVPTASARAFIHKVVNRRGEASWALNAGCIQSPASLVAGLFPRRRGSRKCVELVALQHHQDGQPSYAAAL